MEVLPRAIGIDDGYRLVRQRYGRTHVVEAVLGPMVARLPAALTQAGDVMTRRRHGRLYLAGRAGEIAVHLVAVRLGVGLQFALVRFLAGVAVLVVGIVLLAIEAEGRAVALPVVAGLVDDVGPAERRLGLTVH